MVSDEPAETARTLTWKETTMNIVDWLLQTDSGVAGLVLRITLAVVMFPHGAQKALGWFGGHGFKGTMKYFTSSGIPTVFAFLAIAAEFLDLLALGIAITLMIVGGGIWSLDGALASAR
jgi:putative oxidoreductase